MTILHGLGVKKQADWAGITPSKAKSILCSTNIYEIRGPRRSQFNN